jgi:hypothetical protein
MPLRIAPSTSVPTSSLTQPRVPQCRQIARPAVNTVVERKASDRVGIGAAVVVGVIAAPLWLPAYGLYCVCHGLRDSEVRHNLGKVVTFPFWGPIRGCKKLVEYAKD